jgi:prepilin peptidase CpaA
MSILLLVIVALAVREDILWHRIPNRLTLAAVLTGLSAACLSSGVEGGLAATAGAAVGGGMLLPLYLLGGLGAGDVKLMGAAGTFLGPAGALVAGFWTLVLGVLLALGVVIYSHFATVRSAPGESLKDGEPIAARTMAFVSVVRRQRFPYAAAIGAGVVTCLWQKGALVGLLPGMGIF